MKLHAFHTTPRTLHPKLVVLATDALACITLNHLDVCVTTTATCFGLNASTLVSNTNASMSTEEGEGFGYAMLDFVSELANRPVVPQARGALRPAPRPSRRLLQRRMRRKTRARRARV